jgi:hypothetical protein
MPSVMKLKAIMPSVFNPTVAMPSVVKLNVVAQLNQHIKFNSGLF